MIRGQLYILTLLVLLVLYTTQLPGQRTQPYFHNFTTEDGLPSSETYCAVQDKDGYMWIGTDNGVARFDGYEFEVFGPEHGLTDVVVFDVVEDTHGTLWFMTYSGQLFWFDGNIFKPYKYNDQIINFEKKTKRVLNLVDVWPDGSVVIRSGNIEMKVISPAGEIRNFNPSKKFDLYIYGTPKTQHSIIASEKYKTQKDFQKKDIFIFKEGNWKQVDYIKREELVLEFKTGKYSYVLGAYNHQNDETFAFIYGNIYYKNSDSTYIKNNVFGKKINYILPHPKEGFWVAMGNNLGTHHCYIKQKNITCDVLLEDITLNEISYDKQGGLWICSQGSGLFYSQNPEISTYNATDKKKFPIAIESIGKDHYLASYNDIGIIDHNTTSSEIIRLDKTGKYYSINQIMKYDSCAQTIFLAQGKIDYSSKRAPFNPYQRNYFELHNYIQDYSHISHLDYIKNKSLKCNDTVFIILNNIAYEVTSSKLESRQK
ncbi:MAG: two-component regulator propeller domain-containing protein, partial [Bacteroidota bacterium]